MNLLREGSQIKGDQRQPEVVGKKPSGWDATNQLTGPCCWDKLLSFYHPVPVSGPYYSSVLVTFFVGFVKSNLIVCSHTSFCVIIMINIRGSGQILHYCIKGQVQQVEPREILKVYQILGFPVLL